MTGMPGTRDLIVLDTKDWTWVLERPCPECGSDPAAQSLDALPTRIHDTAMTWADVLARTDVGVRPAPAAWSPLLEVDEPAFVNWDQEATAVERDDAGQDLAEVALGLIELVHHLHDVGAR